MPPHEQEREKWDQIYAAMDPAEDDSLIQRFNEEFAALALELLPEGGSAIELGSGGGWQSLALARTGKFNVTLLDFSPRALEFSQKRFQQEGLTAQFLLEDAFQPGTPENDLAFNAGVLEHYTFPEQVRLLRAMASRSRKYVLVLLPNASCYWYWVWRIHITQKSAWPFGKEVPLFDLEPLFREAGLNYIGARFLGRTWTETFIQNVTGLDDAARAQIIEIHRSGVIPPAHTGYLIAGLGVLPDVTDPLPAGWSTEVEPDSRTLANLSASLADLTAYVASQTAYVAHLNAANAEEINRMQARLSEMDARAAEHQALIAEQSAHILEQSAAIASARAELAASDQTIAGLRRSYDANHQKLAEIESSRAWKLVRRFWKLRSKF